MKDGKYTPLDERLGQLLVMSKAHPDWLDRAGGVVGDVMMLLRAFRQMHRRAQRAEALALREGQRADRLAGALRRTLASRGVSRIT